jgi:nuclear GTP-binding protein
VRVEPFESTFGSKATRKRPKLSSFDYEGLVKSAAEVEEKYDATKDSNFEKEVERKSTKITLFKKGQSPRIWGELYKGESSSVLCFIFAVLFSSSSMVLHSMPLLKKGGFLFRHSTVCLFLAVIDSSDVVVQVLDARDPMGTRSASVEKHLREKCPTKHLIFVLNKCDLIPTWATARWVRLLSAVAPTVRCLCFCAREHQRPLMIPTITSSWRCTPI